MRFSSVLLCRSGKCCVRHREYGEENLQQPIYLTQLLGEDISFVRLEVL